MRKSQGGWSNACQGYPMDSGCQVLSNCFSGKERIITDKGVFALEDIVGKTVNALTSDYSFKPAKIKTFGEQKLYRVTFSNSQSVLCTANHRWYVENVSHHEGKKYRKEEVVETTSLKCTRNQLIKYIKRDFESEAKYDIKGLIHGLIFGDGTNKNHVLLCGGKREYEKLIPNDLILKKRVEDNGTVDITIDTKRNMKELPAIDEDDSYLLGFLVGYLATDGAISNSSVNISCKDKGTLEELKSICSKLLIRTYDIRSETTDKKIGNYTYSDYTLYYLPFDKSCLTKEMLLKGNYVPTKRRDYLTVKSVEETSIVEEVYCAEEPVTHTIVLDGHILTGQCVGYAYGRFNEIANAGSCKYLVPTNAENFIEYRGSLTYGQTPAVGAVMVWRKGSTLYDYDGAGHVAIVEKVYSNTKVYTSESAWAGTAFFNSTRSKGSDGKWGMGSAYHFRGFIYQPNSVPQPTGKAGWEKVDGKWYFRKENGNLAGSGWLHNNTFWYLLGSSGQALFGWQKHKGDWFYLNPNSESGACLFGWRKINGGWYYLDPKGESGRCLFGWQKIDGQWYYLDKRGESGRMLTGWQKINGGWFYLGTNGACHFGWLTINSAVYYCNPAGESGRVLFGWQTINNAKYYFTPVKESGRMLRGRQVIDGKEYLFGDDGKLIK